MSDEELTQAMTDAVIFGTGVMQDGKRIDPLSFFVQPVSDPACEHCGMDPAALTEQLEAARADAKEAEAYAEELERDLKTCRMAQAVMDNTVAELVKERDEANEVIAKQGALLADAYGAYLDWDEVLKDRADHECKAKLVKAVEGLRVLLATAYADDHAGWQDALREARAIIAEIEGEQT
jgi:chromosome segregation ATPase